MVCTGKNLEECVVESHSLASWHWLVGPMVCPVVYCGLRPGGRKSKAPKQKCS